MTLTLFDNIPDKRHNNAESDAQYKEHKVHFNEQCQRVYEALMGGMRLTVMVASSFYGIGDLRRRIKDLNDLGVKISYVKIEGGHGAKEWYMTFADKFHNKQNFL